MKTGSKRGEQIAKAAVIIAYNDTIGREDKVDQHMQTTQLCRKD